jgi:hypothetical protein
MNTEKDKIYLGLDVGFGDVKLVLSYFPENKSERKKILTKFPTAISYAREGIIGDLGDREKKYAFPKKANFFIWRNQRCVLGHPESV